MDFVIIKSFLPEIFLSFCILSQLIVNAFLVNQSRAKFLILEKENFSQVGFILSCVAFLLFNSKIEGYFFNFLFSNEIGSYFLKFFFILVCLVVLILILPSFKIQKLSLFEFYTLFLFSILSMLLLVSTMDLLSTYLIIEMQALIFYVLACFKRDSAYSTEASLKYFILGSIFSVFFLIGSFIIYLIFGTLNLAYLKFLFSFIDLIQSDLYRFLLSMGFFILTMSFFFKLILAPFHFWAPDVYEGAPLASTLIFTILPKIVLFTFFLKWLLLILPVSFMLTEILAYVGLLSILLGTIFSLMQVRIKRFLIYSSIAQMGFLLCVLVSLNDFSLVAMYYYLFIYILGSFSIWSLLVFFTFSRKKINTFYNKPMSILYLTEIANLLKFHPFWCLIFFLYFFSTMGLPPLGGFFSKIFILYNLISLEFFILAFLIILINFLSAFYYLRTLKILLFESKRSSLIVAKAQFIIGDTFFYLNCWIVMTSVICLFLFFLDPTLVLLISYIVSLSLTFFF